MMIDASTANRRELLDYVRTHMVGTLAVSDAQLITVQDLRTRVASHIAKDDTGQGQEGTGRSTNHDQQTKQDTGTDAKSATSQPVPDWVKGMCETVLTAIRPELDDIARKVATVGKGGHARPVEVVVKSATGETLSSGTVAHKMMPTLLQRTLSTRHAGAFPVLSGEAGSGKTYAGVQLAGLLTAALQLDTPLTAYPLSFSPSSQLHELIGFQNVTGEYVPTDFYRAWLSGGVVILDELDATDSILLGLNSAIANGRLHFPGIGVVERHQHCYILGGMNTTGRGATSAYNGRARIDAACRNRAIFLQWDYDEALEMQIAGDTEATRNWVLRVQALRKALTELKSSGMAPDILISPRASIIGASILRDDATVRWTTLEDELIWQGATDEDKRRVVALVA